MLNLLTSKVIEYEKKTRLKIYAALVTKKKNLTETEWRIQNKAKKKQIEVSQLLSVGSYHDKPVKLSEE